MNIFNTLIDYLRSSKNELTKVTWPSRQDTIRYSTLVIGISVCVAVFFGLLDMGLSRVVTTALANKRIEQPATQNTPIMPTVETTQPETTEAPKTIQFDQTTPITTPTDNANKTQ